MKLALKRVMMHHGFFMFQFESKSAMEKVMESGPWRIQLVPIILKVWTSNMLLQKEYVSCVPLWVKMHNVPIVAYSKVGLDLISAKVGKLMRLDAHTNFICNNSWGRSDYARALVEVSADKPLPPRCDTCKIFDHLESMCPMKRVAGSSKKSDTNADVKKDTRPVHATSNKGKGKQPSPPDSSQDGKVLLMITLILAAIRDFVMKSMHEDSVLEYVGNKDINSCTLMENQGEMISSKKSSSSMKVLNEDSDTDDEEVFLPNDRTTFPSSSGDGGYQMEEDANDDYEDQFEDYTCSFQEFCDQFDFKVKGLGRK
ncbi:zinc knuckle CX2CX4HX4C containing protein [Tanacetum coccineum]